MKERDKRKSTKEMMKGARRLIQIAMETAKLTSKNREKRTVAEEDDEMKQMKMMMGSAISPNIRTRMYF